MTPPLYLASVNLEFMTYYYDQSLENNLKKYTPLFPLCTPGQPTFKPNYLLLQTSIRATEISAEKKPVYKAIAFSLINQQNTVHTNHRVTMGPRSIG